MPLHSSAHRVGKSGALKAIAGLAAASGDPSPQSRGVGTSRGAWGFPFVQGEASPHPGGAHLAARGHSTTVWILFLVPVPVTELEG